MKHYKGDMHMFTCPSKLHEYPTIYKNVHVCTYHMYAFLTYLTLVCQTPHIPDKLWNWGTQANYHLSGTIWFLPGSDSSERGEEDNIEFTQLGY